MQWPSPVRQGIFQRRYKRFFADISWSEGGPVEVAHVANTGSLKTALFPGQACWASPAANPARKLRWSLEAIQSPNGAWVGVNTSWPNAMAEEAFQKKLFPHWQTFDEAVREFSISKETRLDLRLRNSKTEALHFVEVKNVTYVENQVAQFPDAVTERGQKHLRELVKLRKQGHGAEILFAIQRNDVKSFAPAKDIDPVYARELEIAARAGVVISAYVLELSLRGIQWQRQGLEIQL